MSLLKKLAGETAIYGLGSILPRLLNYVALTPYFTYLGLKNTSEYGIFTELYSYVALLNILLTYRMETAYFRFGNKPEEADKVFSTSSLFLLASTLLFLVAGFVFAQPLAALLSYPQHANYFIWLTLVLSLDTLSAIPFARLRFANRPLKFASIRIWNVVANIIFIFFFLEVCPRLDRAGIQWAHFFYHPNDRINDIFLANVLASMITLLQLIGPYFQIRLQLDWDLLKKMLRYSGPLIIAGVAGVINQLIGTPMLKYFGGGNLESNLSQGGIYGAAAKIPVMMNLFTQAFNYAAEPFFFRNAGKENTKYVYGQVAQAFTLVACLAFLVIMLYLEVIIVYFVGPNFRSGLGIVPILLVGNLFLGLYYSFSIWYKLADRTEFGSLIAIGGSVITIVLNILLIPYLGIYGPAWAALACYLFMVVASYLSGQKHYPLTYPIGRMVLYFLIALAGYAASLVVAKTGWNAIFIFILNTLILVLCLGGYFWLEKDKLQNLFLRRKTAANPPG